MAQHPDVLLKTMVEKELGLTHRLAEGSPMQGALIMGAAFGLGAAVPVIPYVLLPVEVAIWASVVATAAVLFGIGVVKSRWTRRSWLRSGARDPVCWARWPASPASCSATSCPACSGCRRSAPEPVTWPQVTVSVPTMP